jgi:subtilase family serine protease
MSNLCKKSALTVSAIAIGMLNSIAHAALPALPMNAKPRPPYHIISTHAAATPSGFSPAGIIKAYGFPANFTGAGETIAIIVSGDDPNIESDLNTFATQFGLPACTTANGCFTKIFSNGTPPGDSGWGVESSLDVEWAHAIAPQAKILLIESYDAYGLYDAVSFAIAQHPSVISLSWGSSEFSSETYYDPMFQSSPVPIVAASGDSGNGVWYPAASPYVVGAGGTQISLDKNGNYVSETAWTGSGGGQSVYESEPAFQSSYVIAQPQGRRGVPDISYNASGSTPYAVYDSYNQGGWLQIAGTSAAAPQWAALIADMKAAKNGNFANFNGSIYSVARETTPSLLHYILTGSNGSCDYYCQARSGYNYVTGLGSPISSNLINRFD